MRHDSRSGASARLPRAVSWIGVKRASGASWDHRALPIIAADTAMPQAAPLALRLARSSAAVAAALLLAAAPSLAAAPAPPAAAATLAGQVLEVQPAGGYTYLRLKTAEGETWAAVAAADVARGAQVSIANPMVMEKFQSKALGRTFERIVFGTLAQGGAVARAAALGATAAPGHGAAPAPAAPVASAKVARAEGPEGRTVAEIHGTRARLAGKAVAVRGQVVKLSLGIMGKNWVHLRDGSGSAGDGSNDLLVTTQDKPAVGDVVVARGTVRTDVDLGSGYRYAVLVEGAALNK